VADQEAADRAHRAAVAVMDGVDRHPRCLAPAALARGRGLVGREFAGRCEQMARIRSELGARHPVGTRVLAVPVVQAAVGEERPGRVPIDAWGLRRREARQGRIVRRHVTAEVRDASGRAEPQVVIVCVDREVLGRAEDREHAGERDEERHGARPDPVPAAREPAVEIGREHAMSSFRGARPQRRGRQVCGAIEQHTPSIAIELGRVTHDPRGGCGSPLRRPSPPVERGVRE